MVPLDECVTEEWNARSAVDFKSRRETFRALTGHGLAANCTLVYGIRSKLQLEIASVSPKKWVRAASRFPWLAGHNIAVHRNDREPTSALQQITVICAGNGRRRRSPRRSSAKPKSSPCEKFEPSARPTRRHSIAGVGPAVRPFSNLRASLAKQLVRLDNWYFGSKFERPLNFSLDWIEQGCATDVSEVGRCRYRYYPERLVAASNF